MAGGAGYVVEDCRLEAAPEPGHGGIILVVDGCNAKCSDQDPLQCSVWQAKEPIRSFSFFMGLDNFLRTDGTWII